MLINGKIYCVGLISNRGTERCFKAGVYCINHTLGFKTQGPILQMAALQSCPSCEQFH